MSRKAQFLFLFLLCSCAFTPHKDNRKYQTSTPLASNESIHTISILVTGEESNVIGYIRNNYGAETANIEIPHTKKDLIQLALEQEFSAMGFKVVLDSPNKILTRVKQVELELAQEDGKAGYFAVCDLQTYLQNKSKIVERNFVEYDKIDSIWYVTAEEGITTFYKNITKCSNSIVKEISKRIVE